MVFYFWKLKTVAKYYIGKNPLYATGDYRKRLEGAFVKASSSASCAHAPVMPRMAASVNRNLFVAFIVYLLFYLLLFMVFRPMTIHETKRI